MATDAPTRASLARSLFQPIDNASLAAFRILFGALMLASIVRFWSYGWIRDIYIAPPFHFHWLGFSWVSPWPGIGMYIHFAVLGLASLLVMLGLFYRAAAALFFVTFTYVELVEKATYLNHYYLISLLALLMTFMPLHHTASIDALRKPHLRSDTAPAWTLWLLRFQIGIVYFFAGFAKIGSDWLLRGEPLGIWLAAHTDIPLVGPLLAEHWVARAASFFGAAFDLSVVFFLLNKRARPYAYAMVVVFHAITGYLFPIGVFPWVMSGSALVFFPRIGRENFCLWLPGNGERLQIRRSKRSLQHRRRRNRLFPECSVWSSFCSRRTLSCKLRCPCDDSCIQAIPHGLKKDFVLLGASCS